MPPTVKNPEKLKAAIFALALNRAHVLTLNIARVLRLNKADVLALNKAHVLRLNTKIRPVFTANTKEAAFGHRRKRSVAPKQAFWNTPAESAESPEGVSADSKSQQK